MARTTKKKPKRKKRAYTRSRPHNAKISDESIEALRRLSSLAVPVTQAEMARLLHISERHVRRLLNLYGLSRSTSSN